MLVIKQALERLDIPTNCVTAAVQAARALLDQRAGRDGMCRAATKLIKQLISIEREFDNEDVARVTALALIEAAVKNDGVIEDEQAALDAAYTKALSFVNNPNNQWMFAAKQQKQPDQTAIKEVRNVAVPVKPNGKIARGGKLQLAQSLFKQYVLEAETPLTNSQFVQLLVKEGQFTLAGARTYATNLRKQYGLVNSR